MGFGDAAGAMEIFSNPDVIKSLVMAFGKPIADLLIKGGNDALTAAGELTNEVRVKVEPVVREYIQRYTDRHGHFKVLGMSQRMSLDTIYTQVSFNPDYLRAFETGEAYESSYRDRKQSKQEPQPGKDVANEHPYLMVLGGPGMGKTTFLRKVGLEALKQGQGEYDHILIPVFLELRQCREEKDLDLVAKISEEFKNCGLEHYEDCTEQLLKNGKLLILLDGLDEVPIDLLPKMTRAIQDLVDRYDKNRFVVSCRIAFYRSFEAFQRFRDIAIADFSPQQMESLIQNWFQSHGRLEWGQRCWAKLTSDEHRPTLELAKTPLFLTLVCILFQDKGGLPNNRATLYEKAVSVLLEGLDSAKQIERQRAYEKMDGKRRELMLEQIAYDNFAANRLFFQQGEIALQIEAVLKDLLREEDPIDGKKVLKEVEEHHGLLVNRYDDVFSFSHLTIQEFLTAKHVVDNNLDVNKLVTEHLHDKRWREVFLLLAGLRNADDLLLAVERKSQTYMTTPKLQQLLVWVDQVSDPSSGDFQPVGKRAITIAFANAYANAYAIANANAIAIANAIAYANAYAYAIANAIANANAIAYAIAYANANAYAYANANANANAIANANANANAYTNAIKYFIEYAEWAMQFEIYHGLDLENTIEQLKKLQTQIPDDQQPNEKHQAFGQQLISIFLAAFHLTPEMVNLSKEEVEAMDNYLYATRLLIECDRAAVRRTSEIWKQIEGRMLRPTL
jgi:predicted NACHT family NTPase